MTQQAELFREIEKLPPQDFGQVIDFVRYLQHKAAKVQKNNAVEQPQGRRGFGIAKGQFRIADDFDAPLDDFKDYM